MADEIFKDMKKEGLKCVVGLAAPLFTIRKTSQAATGPSRMTDLWLIPTSVEPSPAEASLDRPGPAVLQTRASGCH